MDSIEPIDGKQIQCITTVQTVSFVQQATAIAISVEVALAREQRHRFSLWFHAHATKTELFFIESSQLSCLV